MLLVIPCNTFWNHEILFELSVMLSMLDNFETFMARLGPLLEKTLFSPVPRVVNVGVEGRRCDKALVGIVWVNYLTESQLNVGFVCTKNKHMKRW